MYLPAWLISVNGGIDLILNVFGGTTRLAFGRPPDSI
jgi:hypothetical protein